MTAIAWIKREMRRHDNSALVEASKGHDQVVPFYVVDEDYFERTTLGYPRVKFWRDSLLELEREMEDLVVRKGSPVEQLKSIVEEADADSVYHNRDYSPYARERDSNVSAALEIPVKSFKDLVMFEKEEILTNAAEPYKVYSYYAKKWFDRQKPRPRQPEDFSTPCLDSDRIPSPERLGFEQGDMEVWDGGREKGLERLRAFREKIGDYAEKRDYPAKDATSKLSPHLKFGTVSVREVFWEAERAKAHGKDEEGVRTWQEELAWRDFYFQVLWNFPRTVNEPFLEKYRSIDWRSREQAKEHWRAFIEGETGYPFVDAGMRQLKKTGWMHNRLRMVVASFAAKDLFLDWKDLHNYFKRMFVDAELSAMVGGIQWAYSIGTDAQPYFRVFNPWKQGEKFDPEGEYIREHVPELEDVPDEYIHRPCEMPDDVQEEASCIIGEDYPAPIIEHDERREKAVKMFEEASDQG